MQVWRAACALLIFQSDLIRPVAEWPSGFSLFLRDLFGGIVRRIPMSYTGATEHHMTLLNKVFTTRTLVQIIFVLAAAVILKAASLHYDFSWATALAAG